MYYISNDTRLADMSLPGTHDTMTEGGSNINGPFVQTQSMTLMEQLYSGLRVFDIRLVNNFDLLQCFHGIAYLYHDLDDVLRTTQTFLANNPFEAVFMRVGNQGHGIGSANTFKANFRNICNKYGDLIAKNIESNPMMQDIRGQVVLLRDGTNDFPSS